MKKDDKHLLDGKNKNIKNDKQLPVEHKREYSFRSSVNQRDLWHCSSDIRNYIKMSIHQLYSQSDSNSQEWHPSRGVERGNTADL